MTEAIGEDHASLDVAKAAGGIISVAVGLGVYGVATYAYLGLAGRALGPEVFAPLSVLWSVLNGVGIGLFVPFEQELGRRTAERRAQGLGNGPVVRESLVAAAVVLGSVTVLALAGGRLLADHLYGGRGDLVVVTVLALAGMALSYVVRGLLSGNGRFRRYGAQFVVDGVLRVIGAGALWAAGVTSLLAYGLVLVVAPVAAVLLTTPRVRGGLVQPGPAHSRRTAATAMAALIVASLLAQVIANAGPVIVEVLGTAAEAAAAGQFLAALVVARVPLFVFAAVQAVLLPGLARTVSEGSPAGFRRQLSVVLAATAGIGLAGVVAIWAVGTTVVPLLFSDAFGVDRAVITLIAASGAAQMVAQAIAQALLALRADGAVVAGWAAGLVALLAACAWNGPVAERAAWSLLAGGGAALIVLAVALVVRYRAWVAAPALVAAPAAQEGDQGE